MLSTGAFNALLKTLEEPPAHVIFILATTEVHKLPATILSRCQRFDFKRIQPETMAVRLKEVAGIEGLELDDDAAILIARIADGALRDGLSVLDQCAGRSKKRPDFKIYIRKREKGQHFFNYQSEFPFKKEKEKSKKLYLEDKKQKDCKALSQKEENKSNQKREHISERI